MFEDTHINTKNLVIYIKYRGNTETLIYNIGIGNTKHQRLATVGVCGMARKDDLRL